jgi:hypothetical protein
MHWLLRKFENVFIYSFSLFMTKSWHLTVGLFGLMRLASTSIYNMSKQGYTDQHFLTHVEALLKANIINAF